MEIEVIDIANETIKCTKAKVTIVNKVYQHIPFIIPTGIGWKCGHRSIDKCNKCSMINNFGLTKELFKKAHKNCNSDILTSLRWLGNEFSAYRRAITNEDISIATKFIDSIKEKEITLKKEGEEYYINRRYFGNDIQLKHYNDNIYWIGTPFKFKEVIRRIYGKDIAEASFIIACINKGYRLRLIPHSPTINIIFKVTPLIYFS